MNRSLNPFQFLCLIALCSVTSVLCAQENGMLAPLSAKPASHSTRTLETGWSFDQHKIETEPKPPIGPLFDSQPRLEPVVRTLRKYDLSSGLLTTETLRRLSSNLQELNASNPVTNTDPTPTIASGHGLANSKASITSSQPDGPQLPGAVPKIDTNTAPAEVATSLTIPTIPDSMVRGVSFLEPFQDDETKAKPDPQDDAAKQGETKKDEPIPDDSGSLSLNTLTVQDLEKKVTDQIELLKANESLDEVTKTEKLKQLNIANAAVQKAAGFKAEIQKRNDETKRFPDDKKKKEDERDKKVEPEKPELTMTSSDLQMSLQTKRQKLQSLKDDLSLNETQSIERDKRLADLPGLRTTVTDTLKKIKLDKAELKPAPGDNASILILESRELKNQKELESLVAEVPRLERLGILLPIDRTIINRNIKITESEIDAFEKAYNQKRDEEIQKQQAEALRAARMADPSLRKLAEKNQELANARGLLTTDISRCEEKTKAAVKSIEEVDKKLLDVQSRIDTVSGTANASGVELVDFRQRLMYTFESQAEIGHINKKSQEVSLKILSLKEDRSRLADSDQLIERLYQERQDAKPAEEKEVSEAQQERDREEFNKNASALIATQIEYLGELEADYKKYRTSLGNEKEKLLNLVSKVNDARKYIDKKALWLRSTGPVTLWGPVSESEERLPGDIEKSIDATRSLLNRDKWSGFVAGLKEDLLRRPYESAFAAVFIAGLFVVATRLKRQL